MCACLQDRRDNEWCFLYVCLQVTKGGWSPVAILHTSNAVSQSPCRHIRAAMQSPLFPTGNIWEKLDIYGYKSEQLASWSRKVTWLNPSSPWDLEFSALKPSLIPNPSLPSEERTTLSLKERSGCVSPQLSELNDLHACAEHEKLVQLPSTWDYSELIPSRQVPQSRGWKLFQWRGEKFFLLPMLAVPLTG